MVSVNSKTYTFTNGTANDASPVESEMTALFNNDSTLATAVTSLETGNMTISGNKSFSGSNTHSGTNTFSNIITFSHASTPIKTDIIAERTSATGVTIDGMLIKDGGMQATATCSVSSNQPMIYFNEDDADPDEKRWIITSSGGNFGVAVAVDASVSVSSYAYRIYRTGTTVDEFEVNASALDLNGTLNSSTGQVAAAWGSGSVSGGTPSLGDSHNISSITDNGVGDFTFNLSNSMGSANYAVLASQSAVKGTFEVTTKSTGSFRIKFYDSAGAAVDPLTFSVAIFGDQ